MQTVAVLNLEQNNFHTNSLIMYTHTNELGCLFFITDSCLDQMLLVKIDLSQRGTS